jgi:DNA polymerase III subunit epsilon
MTREIVLDTETTGLSPQTGDRIVEIGCVELANHIPTGRTFHKYVNPERAVDDLAFEVHGISDAFLRDKPKFRDIAPEFLSFVGDATIIAHNAPFDIGFLNFELEKAKLPSLTNSVIDTVEVARDRHPGARVSLDALCKHYGIDNSRRTLHGALLDSEILAEVYLELIGGRQVTLALTAEVRIETIEVRRIAPAMQREVPLPSRLTPSQLAEHHALVASLGKDAIWRQYAEEAAAA